MIAIHKNKIVRVVGFVADQHLVQIKAVCVLPHGKVDAIRIQELVMDPREPKSEPTPGSVPQPGVTDLETPVSAIEEANKRT